MSDLDLAGRGEPTTGQTITAGKVRQLYDEGTKSIRYEQREHWLNRAFLAGEQWCYWSAATNRLEQARPSSDRVRLVMDHFLHPSTTILAKLLRRPLSFEVPPSAADDASVLGARTAASVLAHYHAEQNWERLREDLAWASWQGGTGLLCVEWDARKGTPLGETNGGSYGTGDLCASALSITEVATEPGARDIERARWWVKASALPPEQVQEMYGLKSKPAPDATAGLSPLQQKLLREDGREAPQSLTLVLSYFERPTRVGKGQCATVVGQSLVDGGVKPWGFPFKDKLNVVAVRQSPVLGRWTGDTVLSRARSPQTALNASWSSIVEHLKLAGNARLMVPQGALEDTGLLTDDPGEVIDYYAQAGGAPGYLTPPNMPQWWVELPDRIKAEIDDVLGIHDVSRGQAPAQVSSGIALTLLAEQDDTPIGRMAKSQAEAWGRFGTLVLQLCEKKVTEPRQAVLLPSSGRLRPETVKWSGEQFAGQTTAVVPLEAVQPRSRAASYQLATQMKATFPEMTLRQFSIIADLPGADDLLEATEPDADRARTENHDLAIGLVPIPYGFDNHAEHIAEHNRFRKSPRYLQLDDKVRAVVDLHVQAHEVMAAEEMGKIVAKMGADPAMAEAAQATEAPLPGALPPQMLEQTEPSGPSTSDQQDQGPAQGPMQ